MIFSILFLPPEPLQEICHVTNQIKDKSNLSCGSLKACRTSVGSSCRSSVDLGSSPGHGQAIQLLASYLIKSLGDEAQ